jgi:hypothetical protein
MAASNKIATNTPSPIKMHLWDVIPASSTHDELAINGFSLFNNNNPIVF